MGRRTAQRLRGAGRGTGHGPRPGAPPAIHPVLVAHPGRHEARPCALSFDRRGVVLRAASGPAGTRPGAGGPARDGAHEGSCDASGGGTGGGTVLLRIPWWALHGLSADDTAQSPEGTTVQVVRLVTDAGDLMLLAGAPTVSALLGSLRAWTARWRGARRALDRLVAMALAMALAAAGSVTRRLEVLTAHRAGTLGGTLPEPVQRLGRVAARRPRVAATGLLAIVLPVAAWAGVALSAAPAGLDALSAAAGLRQGGVAFDASGMAQILQAAEFQAGAGLASHLVPATAPPPPAPAAVVDTAPLRSHEVFGFAPYWSLGQAATFDVSGFTTLAYFAVGVNANGTLQESGTGWDGYQSQDFANLVARAHAAGDRVVLTVNCFSQASLNALSSSPSAAATLASAVVHAVASKNLDGVNIDFEGQGPADQSGLTALVATVSTAMHAANPHYQVTVDTYASSAGDPSGFYNVPALAKVVDGFFVMSYGTNLASGQSAASPITSAEFSDATTAAQYAAAVPASKVILGVPYFGYVWPTTNGTMAATAMGTGTPISYAQVMTSGDPLYWDPVTGSAWTSYEIGHQWYEAYVDNPSSVYMVAQLAQSNGFAGVGAWALGMDGNSAAMTAALDGNAPPARAGIAGPASTSSSASSGSTPAVTPSTALPGIPVVTVPGFPPPTVPGSPGSGGSAGSGGSSGGGSAGGGTAGSGTAGSGVRPAGER